MQPLLMRALVIILAIETRPPRPPRPSADLCYFWCQKIIEGGIFRGCVMNQKYEEKTLDILHLK